jgi:hypothetical protein
MVRDLEITIPEVIHLDMVQAVEDLPILDQNVGVMEVILHMVDDEQMVREPMQTNRMEF